MVCVCVCVCVYSAIFLFGPGSFEHNASLRIIFHAWPLTLSMNRKWKMGSISLKAELKE